MTIRNHNVEQLPVEQPESVVPKYRPRPYKGKSDKITLILSRAEVYQVTQLLQEIALETSNYGRLHLCVSLGDRIRATAEEHGY